MTEIMLTFLAAAWSVAGAMAPYLLLGFLVAGLLSVLVSPEWVERHLGGNRIGQIFKASLFGVPLPLCSCGVLPVAASLRRHGASKGATTAFLLSTPQTGVDSVAVTWALLGPFLAVFRPVAALVTGIVGGWLVHVADPEDGRETPEASGEPGSCSADASCCGSDGGRHRSKWQRALEYGFVILPRDIGKPLIAGIMISGLIAALIEPNQLQNYLGGGLWPMLAAIAIGVPLYVCATASTPIALGLIHAGLSPGAAIVFLITGPATNAAAIATLWKILGRRTALIYLVTVVVCAVVSGFVVDFAVASEVAIFASISPIADGAAAHHADGSPIRQGIEGISAVVLLVILGRALWPRRSSEQEEMAESQVERIDLTISGMRCNGCVQSLTRAFLECAGVTTVDVDLARKSATVGGNGMDSDQIREVVTSLGFEITEPGVQEIPRSC